MQKQMEWVANVRKIQIRCQTQNSRRLFSFRTEWTALGGSGGVGGSVFVCEQLRLLATTKLNMDDVTGYLKVALRGRGGRHVMCRFPALACFGPFEGPGLAPRCSPANRTG